MNIQEIIGDIDAIWPKIHNPLEDQQPCQHEKFNQTLIDSGQCKTIEEARKTPRLLYCSCPKCNKIKF